MKRIVLVVLLLCGALPCVGQAAVPCVQKYVTYDKLTQHEFDGLVDFTFNVGCGAFRHSTLLKKVNQGDIEGAANEFAKWIFVGKKRIPGLIRRRNDEKKLFLQPSSFWPARQFDFAPQEAA